LRYQEWWFTELPERLAQEGKFEEVIVLGSSYKFNQIEKEKYMFSPIDDAIQFELVQMIEYQHMKIYTDDILFYCDISFPGLFGNVLFHKKPRKIFSFCHATSLNTLDYFEHVRYSKIHSEKAYASLSDVVFVGSDYHRKKLQDAGIINTVITYLPYPPFSPQINPNRTIKIASASRPTPQKVDLDIERAVEKRFNLNVVRNDPKDWLHYFWFLGNSKVLLITAKEETFGYQVVDAVMNGCIPVAPNKFSYPELLPQAYLYDSEADLFDILDRAINNRLEVPQLQCRLGMEKFYSVIASYMKG
jgi:hypothetical protein